MDGQTARRVFEQRLRQGGASAASVVERTGRTLRETSPDAGGWAAVVWSDLDASTADGQIAEEIRHFADKAGASSGSSTTATSRTTCQIVCNATVSPPRSPRR